jgi:hypothetical protein
MDEGATNLDAGMTNALPRGTIPSGITLTPFPDGHSLLRRASPDLHILPGGVPRSSPRDPDTPHPHHPLLPAGAG